MGAKKNFRDGQKKNKSITDGSKFSKASKQPFKTTKGSNDAVKSAALALQLEDEVPDFPRGGGSSLSRQERNEIRAEVDAEFEAEERDQKKNRRKKMQKKTQATEDDFGSLFGDGITGKLPRYANKITLKNVSPGMKLWGVVAEVNEKDLVIGLPGGLRGLVRMADALDLDVKSEITDLENNILPSRFHVGQLVSCIVLQLDDDKKDVGKRKLWLSLRLSLLHKGFTFEAVQEGMVLTAYVKSIQDHGYILHFGLPSFTGFLLKNDQAVRGEVDVKIGQLLQGIVGKIDKVRQVVYLNCDSDTVSKCVTKDIKGISIELLVPGMMVNARVQSTLENGVMLSFLTYFTGTVDIFHLQNSFPSANWKDEYSQNKKVNARILFIDPSTRAIGLTLNAHLVHNKAIPSNVKVGDIYDDTKVVRVDKGLGLLLEIPSTPVSTPAYVSISDVAEVEVLKLEKKFKEGSHVRVRVLGFKHLEGLATGILKATAFEDAVFTHADVKPGMVVRARTLAVDSFGAIVQFPGGMKALCPVQHMSEFEIAKPGKKFKVGAELVFRVLGCKSKRITVTHKKTLVKSKLGILSSYADAAEGLITHGWITKIEKHGCFVRFYNGVQGFAPRSELGLEPGCDPNTMYHVGQVVKCRIMSSVPASRRINLSFIIKPARVSEEDMVTLGSLVSGVVDGVTTHGIIVYVNAKGYSKGTISPEHLADHHGHATLMKSVLKPGYEFDQLLILDIVGNNLVLSAKRSLINSSQQLPLDVSQIRPNSVVHGYICNLIETGCFVRFLGRLTGFSPRNKATDDQRVELSETFYIGQSVRSNILDVSNETGRITVSLKQSSCYSTDASFIQEYFVLEEKIARLQSLESKGSELKWVEGFSIGSVIEGKIQEVKDIGVVVSFEKYLDVFGFITHYQLGGTTAKTGSLVRAVVLDVSVAEHLVDLSLKPEFFYESRGGSLKSQSHKEKRRREPSMDLEVDQTVNAIVEIVKENYLVLSVPEYNYAIGYASLSDYNTQKFPQKQFLNGQSIMATVMALPSPSTFGRSLLLLNTKSEASESKRSRKKSTCEVGSLVQAEITEINPLGLKLKFGLGFHGRVHITEVKDVNALEDPFSNLRVGQTVTARVIAKAKQSDKKSYQWDLSLKPKMLADSFEMEGKMMAKDVDFSTGQCITGYVYKVDSEWVWLTISRDVRAQLFILDSASDPSELERFQKRFHVGKGVSGRILSINKEKKLLRLVLRPSFAVTNGNVAGIDLKMDDHLKDVTSHVHEGDIVGGRISKILAGVGGLLVQICPQLYGRVHFMELRDSWVPDPLSGYYEGQFVRCKVLEVSRSVKGTIQVDLSLRSSLDGMLTESSAEICNIQEPHSKRVEKMEELHPNIVVQGYVKNVTSKGCFIWLSRKIDAKILLSNLSDGYVENPEKEFPVGKLVIGRVLSVEPLSKRVEVTLKTLGRSSSSKSEIDALRTLRIGNIMSGRIKRVESYGLFITIDDTNLVGLCHVSELSDDHVESIETKYRAGERVTAKILKVDEQRCRISLGMKGSYIGDGIDFQLPSQQEPDEAIRDNGFTTLLTSPGSLLGTHSMDTEDENGDCPILAQLGSRASILPLEVSLDDIDQSNIDTLVGQDQENIDEAATVHEKNKRQAKKKAKKERALNTINIREENEKLNIWVAYFNLENEYGNPPQAAVTNVFQRALQYNDPKKVHMALLGMYERTEQHKLADELLDKMTKKFKHSCKVWLRRVQRMLKQQQDVVQPVVTRALLSLPRHKHVKFISQTAILEFKCGVPDRGRSMFEGILREYPTKTDLWSVYLDQEIRLGDVDVIRALFERAISLSLAPKKMKFLFKKYLKFEESNGDEERMESVRTKAMEYVESTMA